MLLLPFFVLLSIAAFITILLHELGHAIPALIFTKRDVTIYLGSHGQPTNFSIRLGKLTIYVKARILYWRGGGMCVHSNANLSINKNMVILICGPITSTIIGSTLLYFAFSNDAHGFIKLVLVIFFMTAVGDLIANLYPSKRKFTLYNQKVVYNDGYQMYKLVRDNWKVKKYVQAIELYNNQDYANTSIELKKILSDSFVFVELYRYLISSLLQTKSYKEAFEFTEKFRANYIVQWNSNDYCNSGLIRSHLNMIDESFFDYNKSLELDPDNVYSLNNRGYSYNLLGEYNKAIPDFNKALEIEPNFAYSYSNRGLAKIKTGQIDDGLKDIYHSISLDDKNSYAYRNLGIYFFDQGKFEEALINFEKAKELDTNTHGIDELITQTIRY